MNAIIVASDVSVLEIKKQRAVDIELEIGVQSYSKKKSYTNGSGARHIVIRPSSASIDQLSAAII